MNIQVNTPAEPQVCRICLETEKEAMNGEPEVKSESERFDSDDEWKEN